jgi:hypothetical protein
MKFGIRTPSLKRRISARTSWKRYVRHSMGLKAPRGMGMLTNPKKALYNKVYNKTSVSVDRLFTTKGSHTPIVSTSTSKGFSSSFLINTIIFFVLLFLFFPLGIAFLLYKLYKASKKKSVSESNTQEEIQTSNNLPVVQGNSSLAEQFQIPEPTKSLLWITDEDTSKISPVHQIRIEIKMGEKGVEANTIDESYNFYSEPSLIWTRLPVEKNNELETEKMYYPTYSGLSPKHRYQYLNWLRDVTKETNLSYVFLYYYGLERQLLVGNYDLAVDEILRLIKHHDKGTFKGYAINALVLGSGYRKRADIIKKAPFILDEPSDISLYLQRLANDPLTAEEIISLANRVGFTNKRYIKEYPDLFKQELQKSIDVYQEKNGDLLQFIDIEKLPKDSWASMANTSIPDEIRTSKFPDILNGSSLKTTLKELLQEAHLKIKEQKFHSKA